MAEEEIEAVAEVFNSRWVGMGQLTEEFEKQVSSVRGKQFTEESKIDGKQIEKGKMFFRSENGKVFSLPLQKVTGKGIAFLEPYYRIQNGKLLSTLQK